LTDPLQSTTTNTVRISATRFEQSPYYDNYANAKTVLGVAAGRYYAADNGEDPLESYWALRRKAVLFDVPEKPWQIEGPEVVPFLERIFARRIETLTEGRGRYAIACTPDGGTYMDGILFRMAENRFCYVQPDGALEEWLIAHSDGFDVKISDPHSRVLQIQGPNSMKIMAEATAGAIDEGMKYFDAGYHDLAGQRLYVSRTGWTGELGYEIYADGASTDHQRLWDHLFAAGSAHGLVFGSLRAMGVRRIEAGILDNLTDFDTSMTPFQAGLGKFIELDKADFIGRAALLEADRRTLLHGVICPSAAPDDHAEVLQGGISVGQVTAAAWSPLLDAGIGYLRFNAPGDWVGETLQLTTRRGDRVSGEIVALPFYDSEKHIPRGVDRTIPAQRC
jgi:glycine cleavage system aminomethyltransferase T